MPIGEVTPGQVRECVQRIEGFAWRRLQQGIEPIGQPRRRHREPRGQLVHALVTDDEPETARSAATLRL